MRGRLSCVDQRQLYRETQSRVCYRDAEEESWVAHVHKFGSISDGARAASSPAPAFLRRTKNIVNPEPDSRPTATSGCWRNHVFSRARKTNFSKTGFSRSLTNVMP